MNSLTVYVTKRQQCGDYDFDSGLWTKTHESKYLTEGGVLAPHARYYGPNGTT
jgi:hypothetical protein